MKGGGGWYNRRKSCLYIGGCKSEGIIWLGVGVGTREMTTCRRLRNYGAF